MNKRKVGKVWEDFAAGYLEKKGLKILFRNWTCRWGEIDLVVHDVKENCLVFVEVKFSSGNFGNAYEAVNFHKMRALHRTAQFFIQKEKPPQENFRFDVVALTKFPGKVEIEHLQAVDSV